MMWTEMLNTSKRPVREKRCASTTCCLRKSRFLILRIVGCRWPSSTISVMHRSRNFCAPEANYISAVTGIVPDVWCRRRRESRPNGRAFDCHCRRLSEMAIGARNEGLRVLGADTIIDVRNGSPSLPCSSSSGSPDLREAGRHRTSPTPGDHRVSPATAGLVGSHLRPPGASIPPWCA